jgi:hypothetical protein
MERVYKKYIAIMILCFVFGGSSLMLYVMQMYSVFLQSDLILAIREERGLGPMPLFPNGIRNESGLGQNITASRGPGYSFIEPSILLFSPFSVVLLVTGLVSVSAGISLWSLVREKEIKIVKKSVLDVFLLPEEKDILGELEKNGGSLTQTEISKITGLSRLKVHRLLKNLEKKGIILKSQYGMTNKIVLKK